jgi:hypothetical protein
MFPSRYSLTIAGEEIGLPVPSWTITLISAPFPKYSVAWLPESCCGSAHHAAGAHNNAPASIGAQSRATPSSAKGLRCLEFDFLAQGK